MVTNEMIVPAYLTFHHLRIFLVHFSDGTPWEWRTEGYYRNGSYIYLSAREVVLSVEAAFDSMLEGLEAHGYLPEDWQPDKSNFPKTKWEEEHV